MITVTLPDNIQEDKGYLGHTFSKLEALCDIQILSLRDIELSVRKLALRWRWKRTKTDEFIRDWRTKSGQFADIKTDTSVYENQGVTQDLRTPKRTKSGQKADNLSASKEKETLSPNNNIIITPIKEKEINKENKPLNIFTDISPTKEIAAPPPKPTPKFVPPTIEQINEYAALKNITQWVDAENFWNFYDSKNWYVGKNKMVRWRSAVSGWALRQKERQQQQFNSNNYGNNRTSSKINGNGLTEAEQREQWLTNRLRAKYAPLLADEMADTQRPNE